MEENSYFRCLSALDKEFEAKCRQCGQCCGSMDDPCSKLRLSPDGRYYCSDYDNRLGPCVTVGGQEFNCVSIREHIAKGTLRPDCGYRFK